LTGGWSQVGRTCEVILGVSLPRIPAPQCCDVLISDTCIVTTLRQGKQVCRIALEKGPRPWESLVELRPPLRVLNSNRDVEQMGLLYLNRDGMGRVENEGKMGRCTQRWWRWPWEAPIKVWVSPESHSQCEVCQGRWDWP
jgi:hypothetical protein